MSPNMTFFINTSWNLLYLTVEQCMSRSNCEDALADLTIHWSQIPYGSHKCSSKDKGFLDVSYFLEMSVHISMHLTHAYVVNTFTISGFHKSSHYNYTFVEFVLIWKNKYSYRKQLNHNPYTLIININNLYRKNAETLKEM